MIPMFTAASACATIIWQQAAIGDNNLAIGFACAALAAAVLVFIFAINADPNDSAPHRSHLDQLLERRDAIYENLRDLKFEFRAGKHAAHPAPPNGMVVDKKHVNGGVGKGRF